MIIKTCILQTTDSVDLSSFSADDNAALFLFHCKDVDDECRFTKYKRKFEKTPLLRFLQSQSLPNYVGILKTWYLTGY